VESEDKVRGILSQSRIVRAVFANIDSMPFKSKTVAQILSESVFASRPVITLPTWSNVSEAFELLKRNSISAIGIVDLDGRLVGNFSASDIKHFSDDLSKIIGTTLERFLELVEKPKDLSYPVSVTPSATLEEVLAKFDIGGIHRVYVIDEALHPIAVISTKDLLRLFLEAASGRRVEMANPDDPNRLQRTDLISEDAEKSESALKAAKMKLPTVDASGSTEAKSSSLTS